MKEQIVTTLNKLRLRDRVKEIQAQWMKLRSSIQSIRNSNRRDPHQQ